MSQVMQINGQSLPVHEIKGQRVVTLQQISELHGVKVNTLQANFARNKARFIEGNDYFKISTNHETDNLSVTKVYLTESGYLLLTKSMSDDLSWQIMKQLVNCYFKVITRNTSEYVLTPTMKSIVYYRQLGLTQMETGKLLDIDRRTLQSYEHILREMGIQLPQQDPHRIQKALSND